jgi:hypothetical protein
MDDAQMLFHFGKFLLWLAALGVFLSIGNHFLDVVNLCPR